MIVLGGKSVFGGIAIGKIAFYKRKEARVKRCHVEDVKKELERFHRAKDSAMMQLQQLYEKSLHDVGEENAMIFQMHQMMLDDLDYMESIEHIITGQKVNAEYAVSTTADNFAKMFSTMEDAYMQGRAADVKDISERVISVLTGQEESVFFMKSPAIVVADDLVPSETVQLDKSKVLGFVMQQGSIYSHTAILARIMNIPAVVGVTQAISEEYDGEMTVLDGFEGKIYIAPDNETLEEMRKKQREEQEKKLLLQKLKGKKTVTIGGREVKLYANIGHSSDMGAVLQNDAEGIGLFRSEFLYLENDNFPTEEEQFQVYKFIAESMAGKRVIIRTLDIGADKKIGYFNLEQEENPALGYRAIRICLKQPEIFKTQLRAIIRASAYGRIAVMFPMITSLEEVKQIKHVWEDVMMELRKMQIPFCEEIELGVMIETPAAVMISKELAQEVDFFSIGTNDLTQYTLAIDRQNVKLDQFYNPHHPAILKMIQMCVDNAHAEGKWVGICGELGADMEMIDDFVTMGVDELSVVPSMILPIREKIREMK